MRNVGKAGVHRLPDLCLAQIEAVIRDDAEVLALWREAMKAQGNNQHTKRSNLDNVRDAQVSAGNSRAYTVSRLQREAPELFAKVAAGEMSATSCNSMRRDMTTSLRACLAAEAWKRLYPNGENMGRGDKKNKVGRNLPTYREFAEANFKVKEHHSKQALAILNHDPSAWPISPSGRRRLCGMRCRCGQLREDPKKEMVII